MEVLDDVQYLDLLAAMSYMSFLRGDIIIEQYEMCKWVYMSKNKGTTHRNSLSVIEDEKERLEVIRKENEAVKDLIENFNNPFLLKYIKQYWEDYDSVQSNEAIGRSFQQLTERELNQLQQENSCHVCKQKATINDQPPCRTYHRQPYPSAPSAHRDLKATNHYLSQTSPQAS